MARERQSTKGRSPTGHGVAASVPIAHKLRLPLLGVDCVPERADSRHRDYALVEYSPRCNPRGRLHSATLLRYLLRHEGLLDASWPLVERVWEHLGRDQVCWGAKWTPSGFHSIELYFVNTGELRREDWRTLPNLRSTLHPWLDNLNVSDAPDANCCSIDVPPSIERTQRVASAHLYFGHDDRKGRMDAFSYGFCEGGIRLENHYTQCTHEQVRQRLRWSMHTRNADVEQSVFPVKLRRCFKILYATKPSCDGIYFNRITTRQTTWFASTFLPKHVARALSGNQDLFRHLLWDVGIDFAKSSSDGGSVELRKFGLYGLV